MNPEMATRLLEIDQLDRQLVYLLERRFKLAAELALAKKTSGMRVIDHERELSTLERIFAMSSEAFEGASIVAIFRKILEESRAVELKTTTVEFFPNKKPRAGRSF